jgi:2-polyprenyl-3-methyl-5-hydroxy-6-metoxy-1,4-benzoquinol methylase
LDQSYVVDIGCGVGGGALALEKAGATVLGTDINPKFIAEATQFAEQTGSKCKFLVFDGGAEAPAGHRATADGIMLQEVIEHVPDPRATLSAARSWVKPGGWCYVSFPPYRSPAGGHHHYAKKPFRYVPWLHLVVPMRTLVNLLPNNPRYREEVQTLNKITMTRFERLAIETGWTIAKKVSYLIRPSIAYQFNLPCIESPTLGRMRGIREYFVTGVEYLLEARTN